MPSKYSHGYNYADQTVRLGVHCSDVAREPMVCWQVNDQNGDHGYIRRDGQKFTVHFEEGETANLDDQEVSEIPVPQEIGEELNAAVEKLGTVVTGSSRVTDNPAAFPSEIDEFERIGWESERNVMWYWRGQRSNPRAYQMERGELVFRAQEWANEPCSKNELVENLNLKTA